MFKEKKFKDICDEIFKCNRCELSNRKIKAIYGFGNLKARIMFIFFSQDSIKDPLSGFIINSSDNVIDTLFNMAGIRKKDFYITYIIKCFLGELLEIKDCFVKKCIYFLENELEIVKPQIIVPIGYLATKYIFKIYNMDVPKIENFTSVFGKLIWNGKVKIYPIPHPSTLKSYEKEEMMWIYRKLKVLQRDCKWRSLCPMTRFYREGKLDRKWIELFCKGDWESCKRYQMEEAGLYHPDNMLPDGTIDENLK